MGLASDLLLKIQQVFDRFGVPRYIWESIAHMETGGTFDPNTKNVNEPGQPGYNANRPQESSWGLFQLNTDGGQGTAYASHPQDLLDPVKNAEIAAPEIAKAYYAGIQKGYKDGPELAAFVAANSGHPGYGLSLTDPAVTIVRQVAPKYMGTPVDTKPGQGGWFGTDVWGRQLDLQGWFNEMVKAPTLGGAWDIFVNGAHDGTEARTPEQKQADQDAVKNSFWQTALLIGGVGIVALIFVGGGVAGLVNGKE